MSIKTRGKGGGGGATWCAQKVGNLPKMLFSVVPLDRTHNELLNHFSLLY